MKLIVKTLENDVQMTPRTMRTHYMCYKRRCRRNQRQRGDLMSLPVNHVDVIQRY